MRRNEKLKNAEYHSVFQPIECGRCSKNARYYRVLQDIAGTTAA